MEVGRWMEVFDSHDLGSASNLSKDFFILLFPLVSHCQVLNKSFQFPSKSLTLN